MSIDYQGFKDIEPILKEVREIAKKIDDVARNIDSGFLYLLKESQAQTAILREIAADLAPEPPPITSFTISQEIPMLSISPGNSPVFTATPVPATSAPSTPPTWVSSDTTNAPITVDATGLVATVALPTTAVVGTSFTLTISYTNADGTVATGSTTQTIVAPPSPDITSFTIAQTA